MRFEHGSAETRAMVRAIMRHPVPFREKDCQRARTVRSELLITEKMASEARFEANRATRLALF